MTIIRQGLDGDLSGLARLRATWSAGAPNLVEADSAFEQALRSWLVSNPRIIFVADSGGELIGMMNLLIVERMPKPGTESSSWAYLSNAFVLPAHRNQGVGSALLSGASSYARSVNAARIVVSPTGQSVPFYARAGFAEADELLVCRW